MRRYFMLFAILLSIFYCDDMLAQSVCSACHGYGKVRTRVGMSTYGISNEKELCSKCGKWIYAGEDHYDTCTKCGGTGLSSRTANSSEDVSGDHWMIYLTPQETEVVNNLFKALMPHMEHITCTVCNGTGKCKLCGGIVNISFDAMNTCLLCGGGGYCVACRGAGTNGVRYAEPQNKQQILDNIKMYIGLAEKRRSGNY